ncbi:MAG: hypothetical protein PHI06_13515 [Desulfobulbaceae bacterium]|nr:hypothetical protein [Desulfobulbaceae bacterium]
MKKKLILPLAALLLSSPLIATVPAWAGDDTPVERGLNGVSTMEATSDTASTMESVELDGVTARPHLADVREAMAKHGMKETHHMMVMFTDSKTGTAITEGTVAIKVTDPSGVTSEPKKMMLMGDGFGADISLAAPGKYSMEVGSKLADAKKRVFTFSYGK